MTTPYIPDYALQYEIPYYDLEHEVGYGGGQTLLDHAKEELMFRGAQAVFKEIYKLNHPVVVQIHIETWEDHDRCSVFLKLHYRLMAVQTRNVVMSVLTFQNHQGKIEWKCPACATINAIEATHCGAVGCGRPRDNIRQEM
jgi:hypothetical protein